MSDPLPVETEPPIPAEMVLGTWVKSPRPLWLLFSFLLSIMVGIPLVLWLKAGVIGLIIGVGGIALSLRNFPFALHGARVTPGEIDYSTVWFYIFLTREKIPAREVKAVLFNSNPPKLWVELHNGTAMPLPMDGDPKELSESEIVQCLSLTQMMLNFYMGLQPDVSVDDLKQFIAGTRAVPDAAGTIPFEERNEAPEPEISDSPPAIEIDREIAARLDYSPRRPEIMINEYGQNALRNCLERFNETSRQISAASASQLTYRSHAGEAMDAAELEYALGYSFERVQFFLKASAESMLKCMELRGTRETIDVTVTQTVDPRTGIWGKETLKDVVAASEVSMGTPAHAIEAVYSAWFARDFDLAARIVRSVRFLPGDLELFGKERLAELRAHIAMLDGDCEIARSFLDDFSKASIRGRVLRGILLSNQQLFQENLEALLKECEREEARRLGHLYLTMGKKNTPPSAYWSIECLGNALLGYKCGMILRVKHPLLPADMLDAAVE